MNIQSTHPLHFGFAYILNREGIYKDTKKRELDDDFQIGVPESWNSAKGVFLQKEVAQAYPNAEDNFQDSHGKTVYRDAFVSAKPSQDPYLVVFTTKGTDDLVNRFKDHFNDSPPAFGILEYRFKQLFEQDIYREIKQTDLNVALNKYLTEHSEKRPIIEALKQAMRLDPSLFSDLEVKAITAPPADQTCDPLTLYISMSDGEQLEVFTSKTLGYAKLHNDHYPLPVHSIELSSPIKVEVGKDRVLKKINYLFLPDDIQRAEPENEQHRLAITEFCHNAWKTKWLINGGLPCSKGNNLDNSEKAQKEIDFSKFGIDKTTNTAYMLYPAERIKVK